MADKNKLENLIERMHEVSDPRMENKIAHNLGEILFITICALLSGANSWEEVEDFAIARIDWLRKYIPLKNGPPSHDTVARVFGLINPERFTEVFIEWVRTIRLKKTDSPDIIAIDGKCPRGSAVGNGRPIDVVSAFSTECKLVLGQVKVADKSNEITAIPELLDLLEIRGNIITIDAMGTQTEIAAKINDKKGSYILAVKGNQKTLLDDVEVLFKDALGASSDFKVDFYESWDKDHGRLENRKYHVIHDVSWISGREKWKGLASVGMAETIAEKNGKTSSEKRYYIMNYLPSAELFGKAARAHWGIESMHWSLDVTFDEDKLRNRIGESPMNSSIIKHFVLNMLRRETSGKRRISLNRKRFKAGLSTDYLEKILDAQ
jgi:predicted transposase YbfD/YdcC